MQQKVYLFQMISFFKDKEVYPKFLIHTGLLLFFVMRSFLSFAQVDNEFWFVVSELSHRGNTGGTPGTLRIATMELATTVTISMPANPYHPILNPSGFQDIVIDMAGNSTAGGVFSKSIFLGGTPLHI